jgi:glyoxylase-like metal-dependent hydrolase (beta-lactamase superfamily II)
MMIDRRTALSRALAAAATCSLAPSVLASSRRRPDVPMYHTWKPIEAKNILTAAGVSGNMVLIIGNKAAILVDSQTAPFGAQIRREAEHLGTKVELAVSTHHHPEITGGNHAFTSDTRIIAHPRCKDRIPGQMNRYISQVKEFLYREDRPDAAKAMAAIRKDWQALHDRFTKLKPADFAPTEVIESEKKELTIGGRKIVLIPIVPLKSGGARGAHTDNDLIVHLPDDDVLIVGGLVSAGNHAVIDFAGGARSAGWMQALEMLESLCGPKTTVVPGEGAVAGIDVLKAQREYLQVLRTCVTDAIAAGKSRAQTRSLQPHVRIPDGGTSASPARLAMSLDSIYEEVQTEKSVSISPASAPK